MIGSRLEPFFLDASAGRIFLLLRAPKGAERCILVVPPFGEEMNKSRSQFALTARALVDHGYAVLIVDLFGTGDSEGEFSDATWAYWRVDIGAAVRWLETSGLSLDGILGVRLGCILAADFLKESDTRVRRSVFWQPVDNGRQFMTQFLRLRVAASMMESGTSETVENLKERLRDGEPLEVAGYTLTPELWEAIEGIELRACLDESIGKLAVIEVGRTQDGRLSPVGQRLLSAAAGNQVEASGTRIPGDPFWSATEIVVNHDVVLHTVQHFTGVPG